MSTPHVPELDAELRDRLGRRFGSGIASWLDELPPVLAELAGRWRIELESLIQRGSMSVVIRCRAAGGRPAVLKVTPDRTRAAHEAAALRRWDTGHVPGVLAVDESIGALLIEAISPGTTLAETAGYPRLDSLAALMTSLHADGVPDAAYQPVADRVAYLYKAGERNYERRPDLAAVIPPALYERGRRLALHLATDLSESRLLHGDLTPGNVLDGGVERGLVAVDPAPCLGDPAFDAIDLLLWRAPDVETVAARAERVAPAIGADSQRLFQWCAAFAAMTALEIAEAPQSSPERVALWVALAEAES